MAATTVINIRALQKDIAKSAVVRQTVAERAKQRVEKAQKELVKNFEQNLITKEIDGGPEASNISGTLGDAPGNLFSYIGFSEGSDPLAPIRDILNEPPKVLNIRYSGRGKFKVTVTIPDKKEIFNETPIPWAVGRSWVDGIEKGIAGFGYYFFSRNKGFAKWSESGKAIQIDNKLRNGRFQNTSYISGLLREFLKSLR